MRTIIIVASVVVLTLSGNALSMTITVDWAGSGDVLTIQAGIDSAGTGDTVLVLAGTYTGADNRDLDFGGTSLLLMSDGGYTVTTVDCEDAGRGFIFQSGEDTTSVVRGFTITNAAADSGAGAFCTAGSSPRFEDCLFLTNIADERGGGLCCVGSSPIVRDCRFEQNTTIQGASGYAYGAGMACLSGSSPLIVDTDFNLNESYRSGGGFYSHYSSPNCIRCEFVGNNLATHGVGGGGAGVFFSDGTVFTDCTFRENGTAETIVGAGLYVSASELTVTNCAFIDNTAGSSGGAHFLGGSSGTVTDCTFAKNVTTWGPAAAGLSCYSNSNPTITNCTFVDHDGDHIWCLDSSPTVEYCILAFSGLAGPVQCRNGTETPHVHHCFVYGNAGTDTLCGGNFHDIIDSDPLLCDMAGEDYRLCEDSPCLPGVTWPSLVGAHGQGCPPCGGANQAPQVTVTSPNGGEDWTAGSINNIAYTATDADGDVLVIDLFYSTNGGSSWTTIATGQSNTGTYPWTVPGVSTTQALVKVCASDGQAQTCDQSNNNFTISGGDVPVLQVVAFKNPGKLRSIHIVVKVSNGSGGPPVLTVDGLAVSVSVVGDSIYRGQYWVPEDADSITVKATDENSHGLGSDQVTIEFD